ncbi:MAG TPA: hypothetical protein PKD90_06430 [Phnomibacter sp.]|nr:hypothetical protein [Phnomibacter sp.]
MKVAIAGASGLTGSACLPLLLKNPDISQVFEIGRTPSGLQHSKLQKVPLIQGKPAYLPAVHGFICCLGTTLRKAGSEEAFKQADLHLPIALAEGLFEQGCTRMAVISAMGANSRSLVFYNRVKGDLEATLTKMNWEALYILRPSFINGKRKEKRPFETLGKWLFKAANPLLTGSLANYRIIEAHTIAQALVQVMLHGQSGQHTYLSEDIKKLVLP